MSITIRYYGLIADILKSNEEEMSLSASLSIDELIAQYYLPKFKNTNPIHCVAINNTMVGRDTIIKNGDIIDLMPAFAGG